MSHTPPQPPKRTYELIKDGTRVQAIRTITIVGPLKVFIQEGWTGTATTASTSGYVSVRWAELSGAIHTVHRDGIKTV